VREGRFLLIYLHPEIVDAHSSVVAWLSNVDHFRRVYLAQDHDARVRLLALLSSMEFPNAEARFSRLHVLDAEIGQRFARILGAVRFTKLVLEPTLKKRDDQDGRRHVESLITSVRDLEADISFVLNAAESVLFPDL